MPNKSVLGIDADLLLIPALTLELDNAVDKRVKSIVAADTYVIAYVELSASLSDEYIACEHELTVRPLDT